MKKLIAGILIVVLLMGVAACGAAEEGPTWADNHEEPAVDRYGAGEQSKSDLTAPMPTVLPTIMAPSKEGDDAYVYGNGESISIDRMIVRTGEMYLVVEDVSMTMQQVTALAETYGGWVVNSNVWQDGERTVGNISIRVLAENFSAAVSALRGMAVEVNQESTSGRDVTEEYVDLSARLSNLEASEAQLLDLMETAGNVTEILEVQRELTSTRSEIEQIKGRMQYLEESSSTSLIQVYLEQSKLTIEFYADSRNVKEGEEIRFYAEISGGFSPYTFEWDFGDGETSTDENPKHAYDTDGDYTVTLKVTDDRGGTADYERIDYITVSPGWDAGSVAGGAWNGLVGFGRVLLNIIIWLGIFSPVWIIIGLIIYFSVRRRRNRNAGK
jgi:hypothetical protein